MSIWLFVRSRNNIADVYEVRIFLGENILELGKIKILTYSLSYVRDGFIMI